MVAKAAGLVPEALTCRVPVAIFEDMIDLTSTHAFFYTEWPSNFFQANFKYKEHDFFCTEQAFMWQKAVFFNDSETANKILKAQTPPEAKALGREVKNYVDEEWDKVRFDVMYEVNLAKYSQNPELAERLLAKGFDGKEFVEASPIDRIWGIGIGMNDKSHRDVTKWKGRNLLGQVITKVRNTLLERKNG